MNAASQISTTLAHTPVTMGINDFGWQVAVGLLVTAIVWLISIPAKSGRYHERACDKFSSWMASLSAKVAELRNPPYVNKSDFPKELEADLNSRKNFFSIILVFIQSLFIDKPQDDIPDLSDKDPSTVEVQSESDSSKTEISK